MYGFHLLRQNGNSDTCTESSGRVLSPTDLCLEAVRLKVIQDHDRFKKIKKIIMEHRVNIEAELREKGKGKQPLPHIVLDKLLDLPPYDIKENSLQLNQ